MKRIIGALLAAGVLVLSGCADFSEQAEETTTQETTTEAAQPEYAMVGDTIPVDCVGNECSGELKVEKAQLGGECEVPLVAEDVPEGMQLIQLRVSDCLCVGAWFTSNPRIGQGKPRLVG